MNQGIEAIAYDSVTHFKKAIRGQTKFMTALCFDWK